MKQPPLIRSFANAWRGLRLGFRMERSFRLQIAAALFIIASAVVLPFATWERVALLFVTMVVLVLELVNSSMERLVDLAKPRLEAYAGDIKDLMAAAVLLASLFAAAIGVIIYWPYLFSSLSRV